MPLRANKSGDKIIASGDDELDIIDIFRMLLSGWPIILGSLVISLAAAWLYLSVERPQFQAEAVLTTGRAPTLISVAPVETQNETLSRIRSPEFVERVSEALGWSGDAREQLLRNSLNATTFGPEAVQLSFRTLGSDDAKAAIGVMEQVMRDQFATLAEPIALQTESALQGLIDRIGESEELLANIVIAYDQAPPDDASARADLLTLQRDVMGDLVSLRLQRTSLEAGLESDRVGPPTLMGEPSISGQPVHPVRNRVLAVAGFVGLSFGVLCCALFALARHLRRPSRRDIPGT